MTIILYVSLFIIWLLGYVNAVQTFDNDADAVENTVTSHLAINVASALWPVALCIAILSIVVKVVFGKNNKGGKK